MSSTSLYPSASLVLAMVLVLAIFAAAIPPAQGQIFEVLHSFKGGADGASPTGDLTLDERGNLHGTTTSGGTGSCSGGCGTVFMISSKGQERVRYSFTDTPDGSNPNGGLVLDHGGDLYGTTANGGTFGVGTVFKLDRSGNETVLYDFTGGLDGSQPNGPLIRDAGGNLYGTTLFGGSLNCGSGCGVVFKLDRTGKETVLYSFLGGYQGPDGAWPHAGLILDNARNLYGTTSWGGPSSYGAVFKVTGHQVTVLHGFSDAPDGRYPFGPVIEDAAGNLYGTTQGGGQGSCYAGIGCGILFKIDATGTETVLYRFAGPPDGAGPVAGLILDTAGNLYGTTSWGGIGNCFVGCGTVFELDTTGTVTVLYSFRGNQDGASPVGGLAADASGRLYGTASGGGDRGLGVAFRITSQ